MANAALIRRGGIYRLQYLNWKKTPNPLVFVLYSGIKLHCLTLNCSEFSTINTMQFISFIKKMRQIKGVENYTGLVLYKLLRQYYPDIIRKSYRTMFIQFIGGFSLVSYGILPKEIFTSYEKSAYNESMYNDGSSMLQTKTINFLTNSKYVKHEPPPLYVAPTPEVKTPTPVTTENKNATPVIPTPNNTINNVAPPAPGEING